MSNCKLRLSEKFETDTDACPKCKPSEIHRQRAIGAGFALLAIFCLIGLIGLIVGGSKLLG